MRGKSPSHYAAWRYGGILRNFMAHRLRQSGDAVWARGRQNISPSKTYQSVNIEVLTQRLTKDISVDTNDLILAAHVRELALSMRLSSCSSYADSREAESEGQSAAARLAFRDNIRRKWFSENPLPSYIRLAYTELVGVAQQIEALKNT